MNRSWHHYEKWECVPAGMYETLPPSGYSSDSALLAYTEFLGDSPRFESAIKRVLQEWPVSCEQFLSNANINRIAWIGQSSMCIETGVPCKFRAGFARLTEAQQNEANAIAGKYLARWESCHQRHANISETPPPRGLRPRIAHYMQTWRLRGYPQGIPDEVPSELMRLNLAPSHKAIATAILKNDHALASLGYTQPVSRWYGVLKKIEIEERMKKPPKVTEPTSGEKTAQLCGLISGLPAEFDRAVKALDEIKRRSDKALEYGLLTVSRAEKLSTVSAEAAAVRGTLVFSWKIVDGIIAAGITEPEQEIEL